MRLTAKVYMGSISGCQACCDIMLRSISVEIQKKWVSCRLDFKATGLIGGYTGATNGCALIPDLLPDTNFQYVGIDVTWKDGMGQPHTALKGLSSLSRNEVGDDFYI
jgi:hypothetical protein